MTEKGKLPLWQHQLQVKEIAKKRSWYALFMEMGTGKSRSLLEILRDLFNGERRVMHTLILCPAIVVDNWPNEINDYTNFPLERVIPLKGPGPKRLKALASARMKYPEGFIAITNYEAVVSIKGMFEALLDWGPEVVVCDESQRIKTHNSKRTQKVIKLGDQAKYRYALSGSPILNSPMDAWGQFRFMDRGHTFGSNFWGFRARFFYDKNAGMPKDKYFPDWRLRPGADQEMQRLLSQNSMIIKKADCLDLPPLVKKTIWVDLSPEQHRHYLEMKHEFITFIGDKACTAQLAIVKALRLQQIISGHMPITSELEDGEVVEFRDTPRERALKELLEDLLEDPKHKVIVWACWRHNYEVIRRVCAELGVWSVEVHGSVSERDKAVAVEQFRSAPDCRVFIGHPGSGGIGINLVEAQYMIYYSRNFNLQDDAQSEARNYRGGSEIHEKITRIDLVAQGTIDAEIQKALAEKKQIGDVLLRSIATNI